MRQNLPQPGYSLKFLARAAIIGALYAGLTVGLAALSYQVSQIRFAEALTVLPFFFPEAIPGLFLGALIANLFSPFGLIDVIFGSLITLVAAACTYLVGRTLKKRIKKWPFFILALILAPLFPVVFNSFGVSYYLLKFGLVSGYTYLGAVLSILTGELIACYLLGAPLLATLMVRYTKTGETY
ncbi:MAG: QueT transporter family protein [Coprothermobacterota bacterium]|nr:QueT transporter family protein [Caldisericota bacterium]MDI6869491.1 QueT transporter family protein [Coprothermobacterota bacterium]